MLFFILIFFSKFILFFFELFRNGYPQYDVTGRTYDAHPYPIGWPDNSFNSEKVCNEFDLRLCSNYDLINLTENQQRGFCSLSWAYFFEKGFVSAFIANSANFKCIDGYDHYGVFPDINLHFSSLPYFICIHSLEKISKTYECSGNGSDYIGLLSRTEDGQECQMWDIQTPNNHPETPLNKEYSMLKKNYCRNPDDSPKPWCYYKNKIGRNYCNINCAPFGDFDGCYVKLFDQHSQTGNSCTINVNSGEIKLIDMTKKSQCGESFEHRVKSIELAGTFCTLTLYDEDRNMFTYTGNNKDGYADKVFIYMILVDSSSDVIMGDLLDYTIIKGFSGLKGVHICKSNEIDYAIKIVKMKSDFPDVGFTSETDELTNGFLYTFEKIRPAGIKKSWCCLNEHPILTQEYKNVYDSASLCASKTHISTFDFKEHILSYTRSKRVCTEADLMMHYYYRRKQCAQGITVKSPGVYSLFKVDGGPAAVSYPISGASLFNQYRVWCCDEDCLPLNYLCGRDSNCCSQKCVNSTCADPLYDEYYEYSFSFEEKLPTWLIVLIIITVLYTLGWLIRFCCPKRKKIGRSVKLP